MNSKNISRLFFVFLALGLFVSLAAGCNAVDTVPTPSPTVTTAPTETLLPVLPTSTYAYPTLTPVPTDIPYPTASVVKANAVAFISWEDNGYSLWVANVDGSGERKLANIENNDSRSSNYLMQWSPDGRWISYISGNDLWIITPDGLTKIKLLSSSDESMGKLYIYVWSPDSSKIVFENRYSNRKLATPTPGPESWQIPVLIGIVDLKTGQISVISTHDSNDPMPLSWSPNGQYIVYAKEFSYSVYEVATGKVVKEIKPSGMGMGCWFGWNTWSPNSEWFYYVDNGSGYYNLWICVSGLNGTSWRIEDVGVVISPPVWDITGKFLYFVVGEMKLDVGPNWCVNQRLVRYDVKTHKIETLLSLNDDGPTGFPWFVSISPNGNMLGLNSYTFYEDRSHPGHIYIDSSRPQKNKIIILDIQSLSTTKYTLEFEGEINRYFPPPTWSHDNQKIVFFLRNAVRESYGITYSRHGVFYSLDIETGKVALFSGTHEVENALISPIVTSP